VIAQKQLDALQRWRTSSLANTFALHAAFMSVASIVLVALMSLAIIYTTESSTLHERLRDKSVRVAERIEAAIGVVENSVAALSNNPMFMTALTDSRGRDTYVAPFLQSYQFPVAAASGLALCDINGQRLAGTSSGLSSCRADSPLFKQVLAGGKTLRELVALPNGHYAWTAYHGVVFSYTSTVEGVVVTQLDLQEVMQAAPRDFDLAGVALVRAGQTETLVSTLTAGPARQDLQEARTLLFKDRPQAVPFALEAVAQDRLQLFAKRLRPLVLGYGLAGMLMLLAVIVWTRRVSHRLIAPLTELTGIAHRVAETGELGIAVPQSSNGEVAQLARAFQVMVTALRVSESSLEEKVTLRTAELERSQAATRDRTEQLNTIFDLSPDGFVSFDASACVSFVNGAFLRMTNCKADEVIGLDENQFSEMLVRKCRPGATFAGVAALRSGALKQSTVEPFADLAHKRLIELAAPGSRVLEVGLRLSQSENVSQILYLRDVTHETEVDHMKSEFLSTAAHELRTPMATIYGYCELLLERDFEPDERREILNTIFRQSELMASIINELLDLARIEARRGKDFVVERLALQDIVADAVADYKLAPGRKPPQIECVEAPLYVRADRSKMQQAVLNVLSNAYKYSPGDGTVHLAFRHDHASNQIGIEVCDSGIGMAPDQVQRVCERFYRADTTGKIPGTGLGMSIVKEIVEIHDGKVTIDSTVDVGTTVTLWLPAA